MNLICTLGNDRSLMALGWRRLRRKFPGLYANMTIGALATTLWQESWVYTPLQLYTLFDGTSASATYDFSLIDAGRSAR